MRVPSLIAAAALVFTAPSLSGQSIASPFRFIDTRKELAVFGGWVSPGAGRFGYGPQPGSLSGVRGSLEFGGPLSVEAVLGLSPTARDIVNPARPTDRVIGETDMTLVSIDGRVKLSLTGQRTWHGLSPYLSAGAGLAWDLDQGSVVEEQELPEEDRFEMGTAFASQVGGGIRWFPTDLVVVRAEALLHLWRLEAPEGFRDPERGFGDVGESEWIQGGGFTLGVGYRF
jgi:hypothetical protein